MLLGHILGNFMNKSSIIMSLALLVSFSYSEAFFIDYFGKFSFQAFLGKVVFFFNKPKPHLAQPANSISGIKGVGFNGIEEERKLNSKKSSDDLVLIIKNNRKNSLKACIAYDELYSRKEHNNYRIQQKEVVKYYNPESTVDLAREKGLYELGYHCPSAEAERVIYYSLEEENKKDRPY